MKIINGDLYYTATEVGMLIDRSHLTIHLWDTWSSELEKNNKDRLIPKPIKLGKQGVRYWNESDINTMKTFAKNIKKGDFVQFHKSNKKDTSINKNYTKQSVKENKGTNLSIEELNTQEKLVYTLIHSESNTNNEVHFETIQQYLKIDNKDIIEIINKLKCNQLIEEESEQYSLLYTR